MGHGAMTGQMLEKIEKVLIDERPVMIVVYGDTNSTIAGALAAKKLEKSKQQAQKTVAKAAPIKVGEESPIGSGEETSPAIASYPLPQEMISNRDRSGIKQKLMPICQAILDNEASIVLHAESKSDYRWLAVRLTLCTRRLDSEFRLRHSFQEETGSEPFISLHPGRNSALIGDF